MSNPAQRLYDILKVARQQQAAGAQTMIQGWTAVLGLSGNHGDLQIMSKIGKVFALPALVATDISRFPDLDAELYLGWRNDLAIAFRHVAFNKNFAEFSNRLTDSLLINIRFCAHELEKRMPEKDVSREELDVIRQSAWDLYDETLKSSLPPHLARYLLDHLYLIIQAIDDYEITGAVMLEQVVNTTIGSFMTEPTTAKAVSESEFGDKFWNVVSKVGVALKLGKTAAELVDDVRKLLPH